jgi:hypothetical protein
LLDLFSRLLHDHDPLSDKKNKSGKKSRQQQQQQQEQQQRQQLDEEAVTMMPVAAPPAAGIARTGDLGVTSSKRVFSHVARVLPCQAVNQCLILLLYPLN